MLKGLTLETIHFQNFLRPRKGVRKLNRCAMTFSCAHREWPYPEEEKKPNRRGFGQYKALKGHKHEKESAIRWLSSSQ